MTPQPSVPITSQTFFFHPYCFYSALQPHTRIHPHYNHLTDGTRRVGTIPTSMTGIPYLPFLDRHHSHITRKAGTALEALQVATC